jgi:hypothetical protein
MKIVNNITTAILSTDECSNDRSAEPKAVGKLDSLKKTPQKVRTDPNNVLDKAEKTQIWYAFQNANRPITLAPATSPSSPSTSDGEGATTDEEASTPGEPSSSWNIIHAGPAAMGEIESLFINDKGKLATSAACFPNIFFHTDATESMIAESITQRKMLAQRLVVLKQKLDPTTANHWAFNIFQVNLHNFSQLLIVSGQVKKNFEAAGIGGSLIRSKSKGHLPSLSSSAGSASSRHHGVGLYHNDESGNFCYPVTVCGNTDKTFKQRLKDDQAKSKNPTNAFSRRYPFNKPPLADKGGWDGTFSDLTLYIGLSWNPNSVNEYLTNESNGLFIWDEVSIKKLNESKVTGDLQSKKLIFICCMNELVYSLMLELESVPITPFQPFVGVGIR